MSVYPMEKHYTYYLDLLGEVDIPLDGILSRTLYNDDHIKIVLFGFDAGQTLSEHAASMPAVLHFLCGDARLILGEDTLEAKTGTWAYLPANTAHSVQARTPVVLLMQVIKDWDSETE